MENGGLFKQPGKGYDLTFIVEEWVLSKELTGMTIIWVLHDKLGYTVSDMPFPYSYN